jgi:hypothetical protein
MLVKVMILRELEGSLPHYNSLVKHEIRFQMVRTLCAVKKKNLKIPLLVLKTSYICGMNMAQKHYIPGVYVG